MYSHSAMTTFGGVPNHSEQNMDNIKHNNELDQSQQKMPPFGTFERTSFEQLLCQYDLKHDLPPTIELTQAFLMTQNMKETAARVNGLTAGGSSYYLKNDFVGDSIRLLGNLGTSDKASNFLLEQRSLLRAQARENREIRELIEDKLVDGIEYVRVKEKIAETKSRVKHLLEESFSSDDDDNQLQFIETSVNGNTQSGNHQNGNGKSEGASETQEDSEEAAKNRKITEKRIRLIIKQLRQDAKEYLSIRDGQAGLKSDDLPLQKICQKLRQNKRYIKKRELKTLDKGLVDTLQLASEQLKSELKTLEKQSKTQDTKSQNELERLVSQYEQVIDLDKRINADSFEKSISEIDSYPMNSKSYEIQNVLFGYCGINLKGEQVAQSRKHKDIFGRIRKLPQKSFLLQSYQEHGESSKTQNENGIIQQVKKKSQELVKVIGLEPEKLFSSLDKYKIRIDRMPKFSNVFERAEPIIPGIGMTVAGSLIAANQGGQMTFARVDGRNVISLHFNPYEIEDPMKKKVYESAMKEIVDQREKIKSISKQAREKQEASNIKRAWLNIVKKDIPKAFRQYQKYKADQENNNKKQSQNCLKEVRKKAIKTQRLGKETTMRAKKLTKEMMNFWKKRDKEIADLKRKKEKVEKELKRKQEEEKEALLQKKRLEFIMQQSEIYAHFMAKKLGLADEQQKQRYNDLDEENKDNFRRVEIDEKQARGNIASMINENLNRVQIFDTETNQRRNQHSLQINEDELEVDKFDNPDDNYSNTINPPSIFLGHLKDYQLKGLRWLDNLYEQGINGILADEMGLGKTIQAISLLAHLYETKGVWGPFLIIVPVTTLHNWQNELAKFCPSLKILPYFGSPEERKKLGRFLDPKNLYNPNTRVNVLLTSYNLIVNNQKDQQKLLRVKWHYMILDEAQAIKNNLSRRWKVLLQFNTRNRLLLTGTPIQNSMAELWALLHFIMPKLFDSHEQFQEWFSKDIEQHSFSDQGEINKHQLKRLHLVLKPFMLRRLKKDVEQEIGPKVEYEQTCIMTHRQRVLYQRIKNKISTKDLFQLVDSKAKMENLMNLVMQFRKVCNHPELFERRVGRIPFSFKELQTGMQPNPNFQSIPDLRPQMRNPIIFEIPRLIYDECFIISDNSTTLYKKLKYGEDEAFCQLGIETHMKFFNIFNPLNMHREIFNGSGKSSPTFSILRLMLKGNKWSIGELSYLFVADQLIKQIAMMHFYHEKYHRKIYTNILSKEKDIIEVNHLQIGSRYNPDVDVNIVDFINRDFTTSILYRENSLFKGNKKIILPPLITEDLNTFTNFSRQLKADLDIYVSSCLSEPIQYTCKNGTFNKFVAGITNNSMIKKALLGNTFKPKMEIHLGKIGRDRSSFLELDTGKSYKHGPPTGYNLIDNGIIGDIIIEKGASILELPNYSRLVSDCAKMQFLDKLLCNLYKNNHRCLIFCQMTRMLDILEDFLCWRKYTYFRMDGSTSIPDRRYMVEEYQKNPDIFAFLLSTRAGGLGVNLTAADTVIFYDNDWNPTMDAQATDRAHRIGQTKTVSVYRLVTKGTVEENIVKRAKQKQTVQSTVYGGNALKADVFRPKDVVDMLLDEQEQNDLMERGHKFLKTKRVKKFKQLNTGNADTSHHMTDDATYKDEVQIDTTSKKKDVVSPQKMAKKEDQLPKNKPGRKPMEKQQKPAQNIFSTVKASPAQFSAGPFSIVKASPAGQQQSIRNPEIKSDHDMNDDFEDEYGEEGDEEDEVDEEDFKARKLMELLEKDEGVAIEYSDEEDNIKNIDNDLEEEKDGNPMKGKLGDDDEDMIDEY